MRRMLFLITVLMLLFLHTAAFGQCILKPKADFTVNEVCESDSVSFINLSQDAESYFWKFGDGEISTKHSPKHFYDPTIVYHHAPIAVLVAKDSSGCADSIAKTPIVHAYPLSDFKYAISETQAYFNPVQLGSSRYKWVFDTFDSTYVIKPTYTFPKPGRYKVCLSVTNAAGCFSKTCALLKMNCNAKFTKSTDTSQKFKILLINNSTNSISTTYEWYFGDGGSSTSRNPTHKYNTFGKFKVCLTVNDSGCSSTFCDTIGLDSTGKLLKKGGFELVILDKGLSVENKNRGGDFTVYPNPVESKVTIDLSKSFGIYDKLELINAVGQPCLIQAIESGNRVIELDLRTINPGLYILVLRNSEGFCYSKIVKH